MTQEQERSLIIEHSAKAYDCKKYGGLLVENKHGVILSIWPHLEGYQVTCPIVPNHKTGSSVGITDGYWDYATIEEVLKFIDTMTACPISNKVYYDSDRATIHFETLESAVNRHGNILNYEKVK